MKPKSTPQAVRKQVLAAAKKAWNQSVSTKVFPDTFIVAFRGYYSETFAPSGNNRSVYDDAIFVVSPHVFAGFNANTDPSQYKKGIASLLPGCHPYRLGNHGISRPGGGYPALRPATRGEALPVSRDGESGRSSRDGVAINIHKGGLNTTSSEGCQTIHPSQWEAFYTLTKGEMKRGGISQIWYILVDGF